MIYGLVIHYLRIKEKHNLFCVLNNGRFHYKTNTATLVIYLQKGLCVKRIFKMKHTLLLDLVFILYKMFFPKTIHKYFIMFLSRMFTWYFRIMQKFSYFFIVVGFGECQRISGKKERCTKVRSQKTICGIAQGQL